MAKREALTLDRALAELTIREAFGPVPEGFIDQCIVESASEPGKQYRMLRSPGLGWQHADSTCDGWIFSGARGECRHVRELSVTTEQDSQTQDVTRALRVFESMDDRAIVDQLKGEATSAWAYRIKIADSWVEGISVDGVQEIVRRLAGSGEVIREIECVVEHEDDSAARFMAKAGRYLVMPDGHEVLMDTAIRGKRQSKTLARRDGTIGPNQFWYEQGIAKAVRNAAEALIPEAGKRQILEDARATGRMQQAPERRPATGTVARPNGGTALDPIIAARKEILDLLNEARTTRDDYAELLALAARADGGWPEAFIVDESRGAADRIRPAITQMKVVARAEGLASFLRRAIRPGPGDEPGHEAENAEIDADDLSYE